ncbi:hypothetical protein HK097_007591 [Rhizophlyctis rosea]|uniref:Uncharacterized protein n=1 Tax=Rhizophlyctis rosea TaxID=64517 RepID=A0AAD5X900_9FUNG|nr:hypothetical protein HK097_007591 [Rhizophlyctis rosea]
MASNNESSASLEHVSSSDAILDPSIKKAATLTRGQKILKEVKELLIKHWFLVGLVIIIGLAAAWPNLGRRGGIIRSEYTVKYVCVCLIFLLTGLALKTRVLAKALLAWRVHLVVQVISLGITPLIGWGLGSALKLTSFNDNLISGLIIATATPTTISSNTVMTKKADGDEAAAVTNAVIGNILGVFVTPALIYAFIEAQGGGTMNYGKIFGDLAITVIAPVVAGQILVSLLPNAVKWLQSKVNLSNVNSCLLLILVWSVFCDTFHDKVGNNVDAGSLVAIIFIDLGLFSLFTAIAFYTSRIPIFKFSRPQTVAIVMCAATKTVALGVPILQIIYGGNPNIGLYSTPLLIYHAEQLVAGALLIDVLKKWVHANDPKNDIEGINVDETRPGTSGTASTEETAVEEESARTK